MYRIRSEKGDSKPYLPREVLLYSISIADMLPTDPEIAHITEMQKIIPGQGPSDIVALAIDVLFEVLQEGWNNSQHVANRPKPNF